MILIVFLIENPMYGGVRNRRGPHTHTTGRSHPGGWASMKNIKIKKIAMMEENVWLNKAFK
jgi:hypothetical protein